MKFLNKNKIFLLVIFAIFCMCTPTINVISAADTTVSDGKVPGSTETGGIVSCGRGGQNMCTLCDLIMGIKDVIDYLLKIAVGIAVLAICIGGILYIVSVGDPGLIEMGKNAMKNALIGIVICVLAFIIINTAMLLIGTQTNLGIGVTNWYTFDCSASK